MRWISTGSVMFEGHADFSIDFVGDFIGHICILFANRAAFLRSAGASLCATLFPLRLAFLSAAGNNMGVGLEYKYTNNIPIQQIRTKKNLRGYSEVKEGVWYITLRLHVYTTRLS